MELIGYAKWIIGVIEHQGLQKHIVVNIHINKFKSQFVRTNQINRTQPLSNDVVPDYVAVRQQNSLTWYFSSKDNTFIRRYHNLHEIPGFIQKNQTANTEENNNLI